MSSRFDGTTVLPILKILLVGTRRDDATLRAPRSYNGSMNHRDQPSAGKGPEFATTHWSVVRSAGEHSSPESQGALTALCETYWFPLYAYARRRVNDASEAQDLTQAFFTELLEKNYVGTATPQRGRFRSFLITAFKHFLSRQWERARTQKRGGDRKVLSLDFESADSSLRIDPAGGLTPEQFYDQQWAFALLKRIMERLQNEYQQSERADLFTALKSFIIGDNLNATYEQVAEQLEMSPAAVRKTVSRLRKRYGQLLESEILQTVSEPAEVQDEIRNLFAILEL